MSQLPLVERFPALAALPRARLGTFPSPVVRLSLPGGIALWVKRDDLDAPVCGGNKVRALEFLLGGVEPGDTVLTLGGDGSTHVLATAHHAARLGARTVAVRWRHEMHDASRRVAALAAGRCVEVHRTYTVVGAFARAALIRLARRRVRYVPIGGSSPLGALGHVNAALELARQVAAGALPAPRRVVVPLGSGGTSAGLSLGFAIAGLDTEVVAARVAPRIASNAAGVRRLTRRTARLLERLTGERMPRPVPVRVVHAWYGGAYGRPLAAGTTAARLFADRLKVALEGTYSGKAAAAALALAAEPGPTLFWLTFDGRMLAD